METITELVAINRECDKKNQFINIIGWSEEQIQDKIETFNIKEWMIIKR